MQEFIWLISVIVIIVLLLIFWFTKRSNEYDDNSQTYHQEILQLKDEIMHLKDDFYLQKTQLLEKTQKEIQKKSLIIANLEQQLVEQQAEFKITLDKEIKLAQKRSTNTQRNVIKGQISEQFVPFLAGFSYSPADCQFLGKPIDYVIFHNLHQCADGEIDIDEVEIVFLEVKTGKAKLNKRQEVLKEAIVRGQVVFKTAQVQAVHDVPMVEISEEILPNQQEIIDNHLSRQYEKWTAEEDNMLIEAFDKGFAIADLMQLHKRNHGAIVARLKKLGKVVS